MSDFLAGQTLTALHFPPTVQDTENDTYQTTVTTFGVGTSGGTYSDCGVAFLGCATGRAVVHYSAVLQHASAAAATEVAPVVRTGATVGSGTTVVAASTNNKLRSTAAAAGSSERFGAALLVEGLTPGSDYNVRLEHRVSGGTGTITSRHVIVSPAT